MMSRLLNLFFVFSLLLWVVSIGFGRIPAVQMANYIVLTLTIVITGLSLGSFATALIYRLPRGLPFISDPQGKPVRSMCPPCGRTLTGLELVPVFSWLFQGGKCKCGKLEIPIRYPLIEIFTLGYTFLLFLNFDFHPYDLPRYFSVPFAITLGYLALTRESWPPMLLKILAVISGIILAAVLFGHFGDYDIYHVIINISVSCVIFLIYYFILNFAPATLFDTGQKRMIYGLAPSLFLMSVIIHPVFIGLIAGGVGLVLIGDFLKIWPTTQTRTTLAVCYLMMLWWPTLA